MSEWVTSGPLLKLGAQGPPGGQQRPLCWRVDRGGGSLYYGYWSSFSRSQLEFWGPQDPFTQQVRGQSVGVTRVWMYVGLVMHISKHI